MATTAYSPINYNSALPGILQQLLGQSANTTTSGTSNTTTGGSTTGTSNVTTSAELGPLLQAFAQSSQGMNPEQLTALIGSIFNEGANQVPAILGAYANATGSRTSNNSASRLALDELNRNLSTQAVQALLNYNSSSQQTAANTAAQIANNTRSQQTQQQNNTSQIQTGNTNQQQQQRQTVNPGSSSLLAAGMGALSLAKNSGLLKALGLDSGPGSGAVKGVGTIAGGNSAAPTLTGGGAVPALGQSGATSGMLTNPSASSGFLQQPVAANPYGVTSGLGTGGGMDVGAPAAGGWGNGITGMGGFTGSDGLLGSLGSFGFGSLPSNFNAFGTLGTDSLGNNVNFGSNPYGYTGSADGITGAVGGAGDSGLGGFFNGSLYNSWQNAANGISDFAGGVGDWLGGALGGIGDWVSGFFADGGVVGLPRHTLMNYADGGVVSPQDGARELRTMMSQRNENLAQRPAYGFDGMSLKQIATDAARDRYLQSQIQSVLNPTPFQQLMTALGVNPPTGLGFADGGQINTGGAATRTRNINYMGARPEEYRQGAINYEGYAPAAAVGSSVPAGGSPSLAGVAPAAVAQQVAPPGQSAISSDMAAVNAQAWEGYQQRLLQEALLNAARAQGGGSGGVGEGASPGQNEADNGQAGIGPSGIAGAPPGTPNAVAAALGLVGLSVPGLAQALSAIAAIASAVNAGNASANSSSSPANTSADALGVDPSTVAEGNGSGGIGGVGGGDGGTGTAAGAASANGGVDGGAPGDFADGGLVKGPGTGTSDSIRVKSRQPGGPDIHYSDGEFVIPKDVVDALGADHFQRMIDIFHTPASMQ